MERVATSAWMHWERVLLLQNEQQRRIVVVYANRRGFVDYEGRCVAFSFSWALLCPKCGGRTYDNLPSYVPLLSEYPSLHSAFAD